MPYNLPFTTGQKIIELGGGDNPIFHPNVDVYPGPLVDFTADFNQPLPISTEDFEGIFCSYALEHVSWRNVGNFLKESFRILKPGGYAVFVIPNLLEQAKMIAQKSEWDEGCSCTIFGAQDDPYRNTHMNGFSPEYAIKVFREIGFSDILVIPHPRCNTDMIVEAKKPI